MVFKEHEPYPWYRYSKKIQQRILNPRSSGMFDEKSASERGLRLAVGEAGSVHEGNAIALFLLVDKQDGQIVDAKYQLFGQTALIGAAEALVELMIGKNYDQAGRMGKELIDANFGDKAGEPALPKEALPFISLALEAIQRAKERCMDIPLPVSYAAPPVPTGLPEVAGEGYPGFEKLSLKEKISVIEKVLDEDVRPYIALDAGGVEVINFLNDREVIISYQGACTSCYSSIGTTLSYIQETLRRKVFQGLIVIPDVDFLKDS